MRAAPSAAWQAVSGRRGKLADGFARLIGKMQAAQSAAATSWKTYRSPTIHPCNDPFGRSF